MLAARQELGPEYEQAVIDGFVAQISQSIDQRVEARLAETRPQEVHIAPARRSLGDDRSQLVLGLASLGLAIPLTAIAAGTGGLPGLIIAWGGIAVVNLAHSLWRIGPRV